MGFLNYENCNSYDLSRTIWFRLKSISENRLKPPTRYEVVSDQPPLYSHSENLWSRATLICNILNKNYIFKIPSYYSRLSFREPLGGIIWVSHNYNSYQHSKTVTNITMSQTSLTPIKKF